MPDTEFRLAATSRRHPLARDMILVVALKLAFLFLIRAIWFSAPAVPRHDAAAVGAHLLASSPSAAPDMISQPARSTRDAIR